MDRMFVCVYYYSKGYPIYGYAAVVKMLHNQYMMMCLLTAKDLSREDTQCSICYQKVEL